VGLSNANDRQHGGDHYKKREYQHWDFVCDLNLDYLLGCASKYVARWRDKNGKEDLEKAVHYLEKAMEREVSAPAMDEENWDYLRHFTGQLDDEEATIIRLIVVGEFAEAIGALDYILETGFGEGPEDGGDGQQPRAEVL
jgi:hypothetical protein